METILVDDASDKVRYSGSWAGYNSTNPDAAGTSKLYYQATFHESDVDNENLAISFLGTGIIVFGPRDSNHGWYSYQLDSGDWTFQDGYAESFLGNETLVILQDLPYGSHELYLRNSRGTNIRQGRTKLSVDYFLINGQALQYQDGPGQINMGAGDSIGLPTTSSISSAASSSATSSPTPFADPEPTRRVVPRIGARTDLSGGIQTGGTPNLRQETAPATYMNAADLPFNNGVGREAVPLISLAALGFGWILAYRRL